ncbi:hypothetical protein ACFPPA_18995 [Rhodanobacter ginsengisoli]|uniref:Uncharacterized protein n=1 Tax=Rhodanobacter ginsengisoli TaxID=418646 RepID=A0ABW0QS77_9GAMM
MSFFAKLRKWTNRDDGKLYRAGNRSLGAVEAVGLLIAVAAIGLWQLHVKAGVSIMWASAAGAIGLLLAIVGGVGKDRGPHT